MPYFIFTEKGNIFQIKIKCISNEMPCKVSILFIIGFQKVRVRSKSNFIHVEPSPEP